MATKNLKSQSVGDIKVQSGTGYPNHFAPKGSSYTDITTGKIYKNIDSTDNGWIVQHEAPKHFKQEDVIHKLKPINDKEMFLIKKPEGGTIAFNVDRGLAVLYNGTRWVSLFDEVLHPIIFKDNFNQTNFSSQWSVINGNEKNFWVLGKDNSKTGARSVYITNNGNSNIFSGKESNVHLFFDIYVPKGIKDLRFYMDYLSGSDRDEGFGTISIAPVNYFPKAGKMIENKFIKNAIFKTDGWERAYSSLGKEFSGNNARIIISWHNEETEKEITSLNVDNISLEYLK